MKLISYLYISWHNFHLACSHQHSVAMLMLGFFDVTGIYFWIYLVMHLWQGKWTLLFFMAVYYFWNKTCGKQNSSLKGLNVVFKKQLNTRRPWHGAYIPCFTHRISHVQRCKKKKNVVLVHPPIICISKTKFFFQNILSVLTSWKVTEVRRYVKFIRFITLSNENSNSFLNYWFYWLIIDV